MVNRRKRFSHANVRSTTHRWRREPLAGVDAFTGDAALDAALAQVSAAVMRIVGFIGVDFSGRRRGRPKRPRMGSGGVQQRLERRAIVVISGCEFDGQGDALPVDDHMALGPGFAPIGRVLDP
jgi:hypothetical protein